MGVQSTFMAVDQSNSDGNRATALLVGWEPGAAGPAHLRLAAALRAAVNEGRLLPGDRLPPTRALAEDLALSRWVVTEAYDQLKAEGYLAARVGSGTVVAGSPSTASRGAAEPVRPTPPSAAVPASVLDLSPALPDLASFPRPLWRAASARALARASDPELGYPDPAGSPRLRATLAGYLRRVRGLDVDAERVHVTQGVRNALALLCRHLHDGGARRVAVEDPSWPRLGDLARAHGLDVVPVGVDAEGMRVDDLVALDARRRVDAVFVAPTHQFPTGVPLSAARRIALLQWASGGGRLVVEDDYDAEFRYDRRPVGALAALARDHVVYLGSVSKTLSPALHLGWMIAPADLAAALARARESTGSLVPTLDQLALAELVTSGGYDRHLRRMRRTYQARRGALLAAMHAAGVPGGAAASMDAGLHVLWELPDRVDGVRLDESAVLDRCAASGLRVLGLSQCRVAQGVPGLVLGYGNLAEHRAASVAAEIRHAVVPGPSGATPR